MSRASFGKLGRKPSDPDALNALPLLASYFDPKKMPAPPLGRYWSSYDGTPFGVPRSISMFQNDVLGDCTCAALAHQDQLAAQWVGETSSLTDADVVRLYRGSGYNGNPSSDDGWTNIEAAQAAMQAGWITALARFDATNPGLLKIVVNEFGFAYVGIDLPLSAQGQMGQVWDVAPDDKRDDSHYKRGSWGGHAAGVVDADHDGVTLTTWGKLQRASWAFVRGYFDPSDGIATLNRFWAKRGLAPSGLRLDELQADIARLNLLRWP